MTATQHRPDHRPERIAQVCPSEANHLAGDGALLLDVRELDEWSTGARCGFTAALATPPPSPLPCWTDPAATSY